MTEGLIIHLIEVSKEILGQKETPMTAEDICSEFNKLIKGMDLIKLTEIKFPFE